MITSILAFLGMFFLLKTTHDIMLYQMFKQLEEDQHSSP
jgi:hypothetical protein